MIAFRQPPAYPTGEGAIVLVPAGKFVVRHVPLATVGDNAEQVELAVESLAPLSLAQLYWGYWVAADRSSALVWMACRRHFTAADTAAWNEAAAVLPGFLFLCQPPAQRPAIVLHHDDAQIQAAAWDKAGILPVAILAKEYVPATRQAVEEHLLGEIRRRTGLDMAEVMPLAGNLSAVPAPNRKSMELRGGDRLTVWSWADLASADIRDRSELAEIQRARWQGSLQWRAAVAAVVVVAAAAAVDLATLAGTWWLKGREAEAVRQSALVAEIQSTHVVAHRLEELAGQRLQFMEMLDVLNEQRPAGLQFARVSSTGPRSLEISVRTTNADDARQYETALRALPELRAVRVSNLQTRDGHTDFVLLAEFKPAVLPAGAKAL